MSPLLMTDHWLRCCSRYSGSVLRHFSFASWTWSELISLAAELISLAACFSNGGPSNNISYSGHNRNLDDNDDDDDDGDVDDAIMIFVWYLSDLMLSHYSCRCLCTVCVSPFTEDFSLYCDLYFCTYHILVNMTIFGYLFVFRDCELIYDNHVCTTTSLFTWKAGFCCISFYD